MRKSAGKETHSSERRRNRGGSPMGGEVFTLLGKVDGFEGFNFW